MKQGLWWGAELEIASVTVPTQRNGIITGFIGFFYMRADVADNHANPTVIGGIRSRAMEH